MAVFLLNICKFNECGITFANLSELIQHIESTHIDYDPKVVEQKEQQQPACLPLSYVLRFITDSAHKDPPSTPSTGPLVANGGTGGLNASSMGSTPNGNNGLSAGTVAVATAAELKRKLAIKHHSYSISSSNRSNTPTGSEMDEEEMMMSQSEDSNDSWTTEEFSSEFIMRYGSRHSGSTGPNGTNEKPFACPVPGCKKRYKNVNGIKYHSKNGHKKDGKVRKAFKCHCNKSYKTAHGLKTHSIQVHNTDNIQLTQIPMGGSTGGGGTPSLVNQAIAPPPRSSLSPTGSTCSNTSSTSFSLSSGAVGINVPIHNPPTMSSSSTVQLSPASSISSLSSTCNGAGTSLVATASPSTAASMKSNYGLITIKGKSNNILTTQKFVKLLTTTTGGSGGSATAAMPTGAGGLMVDDGSLELSGNRGSNALFNHGGGGVGSAQPNLVNLGILTPATSPRNGTNGQLTGLVGVVSGSNGSSSSSGCSSMSSMSNSSMESLPLTPVSPTIGKSETYISVAPELISSSSAAGDSDHNMSDNT